jgi:hypothetical protein
MKPDAAQSSSSAFASAEVEVATVHASGPRVVAATPPSYDRGRWTAGAYEF